jgi:protease I
LCHGIEILTAADCLRGKRVTTVPKCALDAQQGGAVYVSAPFVVDGLLVTGQGYHDNTAVLREFIKMLNAQKK